MGTLRENYKVKKKVQTGGGSQLREGKGTKHTTESCGGNYMQADRNKSEELMHAYVGKNPQVKK